MRRKLPSTAASMLSRRRFLARAGGVAAGLVSPALLTGRKGAPRFDEGVYTDRFTYAQGQPVEVHASLSYSQWVDLDIVRHDTSVSILADRKSTFIPHFSVGPSPGITGPKFPVVQTFDTTTLEPGIYEARISRDAMRPENVYNVSNGYSSDNSLARFVVTPVVPGSSSRVLWIHDSLTGTCYGSYGDNSIYGEPPVKSYTVSYHRPGLDRATNSFFSLRLFRQGGHEFEFIDLVALTEAPAGYLSNYDLVVMIGQFEYIPHAVRLQLRDFLDGGGNLFSAAWEFSAFSVRLDPDLKQLTTYKYEFEEKDPLFGTGDPNVAGVTMNVPGALRETEIVGQTVWAAHRVTGGEWVDFPLYNTERVSDLLEGTGLGAGSFLPGAFRDYASGNRVEFNGSDPVVVDPGISGTMEEIVVWGAVPSASGRAWWQADGDPASSWPLLTDGHAVATLQERASGARVVSLPSSEIAIWHLSDPIYQQLLLNILNVLGGS